MLCRRPAVFVGGCTLTASETICNADGDLGVDVLDGIASLVDKSLLRQVEGADGEPRFGMLATVRAYALEQLAASGEADAVRRQHAAVMLALAKEVHAALWNGTQHLSSSALAVEQDNVRSALAWAVEPDAPVVGERLVGSL